MKKWLLFTVLFCCIAQVNAKTELEEKAKVLGVLKKYSETVACSSSFEEQDSLEPFLKNTYTIEHDPELGYSVYYVLWSGDMGCAGGSGTYSSFISEVRGDTFNDDFYVLNNEAFGKDFNKKINTRFIESIIKINSNQFIVVSSDFAEKDANSSPSLKYEYVLQRQKDWSWKVTDKKRLK